MAKIKVMDFLKDVELNRRRLLQHLGTNEDLNLTDAITEILQNPELQANIIADGPVNAEGKYRIRFFDIDGTLLKLEYIEPNGSVVPPPNPSYNSELLAFERWASGIGERFNNLTTPVDYAPLYYPKNLGINYIVDLSLKDDLDITFKVSAGASKSILTIDGKYYDTLKVNWGDGNIEFITTTTSAKTYTFTHNYENVDCFYFFYIR